MANADSRPYTLGLDLSKTCSGICYGQVGLVPRFSSLRSAGADDEIAVEKIGDWFIDFTKVNRVDAVYIEAGVSLGAFIGEWDPAKGKVRATSNPATGILLANMVSIITYLAKKKHILKRNANVQTLRKAFLGEARPKDPKKRSKAMCEALGWSPSNTDEADAGAVWWFGCSQIAPNLVQPIPDLLKQTIKARFDRPSGGAASFNDEVPL